MYTVGGKKKALYQVPKSVRADSCLNQSALCSACTALFAEALLNVNFRSFFMHFSSKVSCRKSSFCNENTSLQEEVTVCPVKY